MGQQKKLGFLGGTFNPIHYGHLCLAEESRTQFGLERILFIPNNIPPHRDAASRDFLGQEQRYIMTLLATLSNPNFSVSGIELKRNSVSYTVDTAIELKKIYPDHRIYFICGADALVHHAWHRLQDLLVLLEGVLIAPSHGEQPQKAIQKIKAEYPEASPKLKEVEMSPVEISSTEIRNRIRTGRSIRYLVHSLVNQYIEHYALYKEAAIQ